jgi:hypothetical protein
VGPEGTEIIGSDGAALVPSGEDPLPTATATKLAEDFAGESIPIDVDESGAGSCEHETADSFRVKK